MRWKRNVFLMLGLVMGIFWGIRQSEVTAFAAEQTGFRQKTGRQATIYNRALQELAKEYGCQYAEAPTGEMNEAYELQFFQTLRGFFYDHTMNLSDIFRYCG